MDPLIVFVGGLLLIFVLGVVVLGLWHPRTGRDIVGRSLRSDEAEADIERGDIDQMIEARNERRREAGRPEIGDELAEEARRDRGSDQP